MQTCSSHGNIMKCKCKSVNRMSFCLICFYFSRQFLFVCVLCHHQLTLHNVWINIMYVWANGTCSSANMSTPFNIPFKDLFAKIYICKFKCNMYLTYIHLIRCNEQGKLISGTKAETFIYRVVYLDFKGHWFEPITKW